LTRDTGIAAVAVQVHRTVAEQVAVVSRLGVTGADLEQGERGERRRRLALDHRRFHGRGRRGRGGGTRGRRRRRAGTGLSLDDDGGRRGSRLLRAGHGCRGDGRFFSCLGGHRRCRRADHGAGQQEAESHSSHHATGLAPDPAQPGPPGKRGPRSRADHHEAQAHHDAADARRRTHEDRQQPQRTHPAEAGARDAATPDRQRWSLRLTRRLWRRGCCLPRCWRRRWGGCCRRCGRRWRRPDWGRVLRPRRTVPVPQLLRLHGVGVPPRDWQSRAVAVWSSAVAHPDKIGGNPRNLECARGSSGSDGDPGSLSVARRSCSGPCTL